MIGRNTYAIGIERRVRIFWIIFTLTVTLFCTYALMLNSTIANVVYVEEKGRDLEKIQLQIASLEENYLNLSKRMNLDSALAMGLVEDKKPSYIRLNLISSEVSLHVKN